MEVTNGVLPNGEQMAGFPGSQRGSRFIHDDDLGIDRKCLGNLHGLLLSHSQLTAMSIGVDVLVDNSSTHL